MRSGRRHLLLAYGLALAGCAPPVAETARAAQTGECMPAVAGPHWVDEGDLLVVPIRCASGAEVPRELVSVVGLPRGASFDRDAAEIRWAPELDQSGVYLVPVTVAGGDAVVAKVGVSDRFYDPANVAPTPATYLEEAGLPVFHLSVHPSLGPDDYTPALLVDRGRAYRTEATVRGSSSRDYPKRNLTLKFSGRDPYDDVTAGFVGRRRLALTSDFDDNSHVRQRLAYELWNRANPHGVRVSHNSAVVYVDGVYQGLYTVTDHVDGDLFRVHGLPAGGNLYKAIGPDANFHPKDPLEDVYAKKEGEPFDYGDIVALTAFVNDADDDAFAVEIAGRVDLRDYFAWLFVSTAIDARDTMGKNALHYHVPGQPFRMAPWDFNESFGQDWTTVRRGAGEPLDDLMATNRLFMRLWTHPMLGPDSRARYAALVRGDLRATVVLRLLEALVDEVALAARRDDRRWRGRYQTYPAWSWRTDFQDFDGEAAYVRRWIADRWSALEARLP